MSAVGESSPECTVYLVGEGPNDIGALAHAHQYRSEGEGFLQPILRRLAGTDLRVRFDGQKLTSLPKKPRVSRSQGLRAQARKALALAMELGADALVFSRDVDKTSGERATPSEIRKRHASMRREIAQGFADYASAGPPSAIPALIALPCRMIEAWALADPSALGQVAHAPVSTLPSAPEELWGSEGDPGSNHPKVLLRHALGRAYSSADLASIATATDLETLQGQCPTSFAPFARDIRAAVSACATNPGNRTD